SIGMASTTGQVNTVVKRTSIRTSRNRRSGDPPDQQTQQSLTKRKRLLGQRSPPVLPRSRSLAEGARYTDGGQYRTSDCRIQDKEPPREAHERSSEHASP